ncbi:MAG: hypothetical protein OEX07_16315, partial [Gammaproteobacteria bacterium]|nr:hypothetical protein [Gammaproteobacteria bacterium]
ATHSNIIDRQKSDFDLFGYFNPVHSSYIQIAEKSEANYLNRITTSEQHKLINEQTNTRYIIFTSQQHIPEIFLQQNKITILLFSRENESPYQYLQKKFEYLPMEKANIHGAIVVVYSQGILITGNSGSGKSSLLLSLLERGHLWVADDGPDIFRNYLGQIFAEHSAHLKEYVHIKNLGPINIDQTFGKTKRIPRHTLAAIIHLSDNALTQTSESSIFTAYEMTNILGKSIPKWCLSRDQGNHALLTEVIAKQLILQSWGDNTSEALIEEHNSAINTQTIET